MALDAMDLDPHPTGPARQSSPEKDRKRKHKDTTSPSKKKRKHESDATSSSKKSSSKKSTKTSTSTSTSNNKPTIPDSPYTLTTATLYLPLSPISISPTHALASLLAEHLSPLLLTYYAPLKGIVLAYSNASISSTPPSSTNIVNNAEDPNLPQPLTLARTAGEYGVLYVYLTATFLVFRPQRGQILEGWVNVQSEGFLGAIVLNLFSVGIERKRLPPSWKWIPPGEELEEQEQEEQQQTSTTSATEKDDEDDDDSDSSNSEGKKKAAFDPAKELFRPIALAEDVNPLADTDPTSTSTNNNTTGDYDDDETAAAEGYFQSVSGHRVRGTIKFRVVDVDVIPGSERESGFLSIEGTMLDEEEEKRVLEEERTGVISSSSAPSSSYGGSGATGMTPRKLGSVTTMSGALAIRSASASVAPEPEVVDVHVEESPSKKKSSKEKKEKKEKKSKSSKKEKSKE
ncbi:hypothetical protein AbraIFM66951_009767 [Aspergillus brasiliensis]|uniref:DNA-directed RNA polymerase subunit n=1 Tax=Aspergillus brasiliensis TaxID=319629 RepID=A0A9W6DQ84_9EURO|nr:hypothetical protein AbraCBS73388_010317 [Aspergillus brasiliensis]GKZ46631.1 hypothetical protein AbraIFM66951_009767 [Aspergillus brasiliensis]